MPLSHHLASKVDAGMQALLLAVSDVAAESACTGIQWYEQCSRVMLLVWALC